MAQLGAKQKLITEWRVGWGEGCEAAEMLGNKQWGLTL